MIFFADLRIGKFYFVEIINSKTQTFVNKNKETEALTVVSKNLHN